MSPVLIPRHPLESPRIEGLIPYGFENMELILNFIELLVDENQCEDFVVTYADEKRYLLINARKPTLINKNNPTRFVVEMVGGYIDFQDQMKTPLVEINFTYYVSPKDIVLIAAKEEGHLSTNISQIANIFNDGYFYLKNKS